MSVPKATKAKLKATSKNPAYPDDRLSGLKPFQKGKSGNRGGKTKGAKDGFRARAERLFNKDISKGTLDFLKAEGIKIKSSDNFSLLVEMQMLEAQRGRCTKAARFCSDLVVQPLPRAIQLEDSDGEPIEVLVKYIDGKKDASR